MYLFKGLLSVQASLVVRTGVFGVHTGVFGIHSREGISYAPFCSSALISASIFLWAADIISFILLS